MKNYTLSETIKHRFRKDYNYISITHLSKINKIKWELKNLKHVQNNLISVHYSKLIHPKDLSREDALKLINSKIQEKEKELEFFERRFKKWKRKLEEN